MGVPDTNIGGSRKAFPSTIWSDILAAADAGSPDARERMDAILRQYWKPVYAYIRASWGKTIEDAKDLAQAFFAHVLQKDYLSRLRPEHGSFRGYLKKALKHFLIDAERAQAARRPDKPVISIEAQPEELERLGPQSSGEAPEAAYDRQWFRTLFDAGVEELRRLLMEDGRAAYWRVFQIYCLEPAQGADRHTAVAGEEAPPGPTYQEVARELGIKETDVRNYLSHCRRALKQILRNRIRDYVASDDDVDRELGEALSE